MGIENGICILNVLILSTVNSVWLNTVLQYKTAGRPFQCRFNLSPLFPEINLALMDVVIPEMDGIEASRYILKIDLVARILVSSDYSSRTERLERQHGCMVVFFIKKPFGPEGLLRAVKDCLHAPLADQFHTA